MISINITGVGATQRQLERVRRNLLQDVDRAIGRAVSQLRIRSHVPIDTGALRSSVKTRRISFGQYRLRVGSRRAYYAHMVNLRGVRRTRGQWTGLVLMRLRREMRRVRVRV